MPIGFADLDWSFGLINSANKYLTAEAFGNRINCAASIMKKKQIWFLEQDTAERTDENGAAPVYIRSHLNKYLRVDGDGKLLADGADKGEEEAFIVEAQPDGRWALKSWKYKWYAGGSGENLTAFTAELAEDRFWSIDLAMHPQICLRNVKRQRYVHLSNGQLTTDEDIPWGDDAVVELSFIRATGTYAIRSCEGTYLSAGGVLKDALDEDCEFIIEFNGGVVSFKSKTSGKYVTSLGGTGLMKASKASAGKDEQYQFENSYPQVELKASNGALLSVKQGVEVAAMGSAGEKSDANIFQLEPNGDNKWYVKANTDKLWSLEGDGIHAITAPDAAADCNVFEIEFDGAAVRFKASNGNYVSQQMNKYLKATKSEADESCNFAFTLINRPKLILRSEFGFVRTMPSGLLECNKSQSESYNFNVEDGVVSISNEAGKFWKVTETGVSAVGGSAEAYSIQLFENSKMAIIHEGNWFKAYQQGRLVADGAGAENATLFEY